MRDLESRDVATAARLAAWDAMPDDDRPTLAELAEDEPTEEELCDDGGTVDTAVACEDG